MTTYSGLFVAIEGIDGSGKTTQIPLVTEKLRQLGYDVYPTSEPSSGKLGPILREYLSDTTSHPAVDALLFAADRGEHYFQEILPKLQEGVIVITDRYKTSSLIYQGMGVEDDEWVLTINSKVPDPDINIYLDLSADVALSRVSDDRDHLEKFETKEMLEKLLSRYKSLQIPNKVEVNAELSIADISERLVNIIISELQD